MAILLFLAAAGGVAWFIYTAAELNAPNPYVLVGSVLIAGLAVFVCYGFFTLQPNEARVLILFGAYKGTVRDSGWNWTNPLNTKLRCPCGPATWKASG